MPNTTNFNWATPADTDLVKDGAAAIRTLGNSIDSSLVDLKGGTTGQVLAKNSNTDLDFTWTNGGDLTEVAAGTGITVTNGTGPIPTVALSTPVAATNGGTAQTTYTTGDLLFASATNTLSKRAIGTTGQVLTVSGGVPTWAAPSGAKSFTLVNSGGTALTGAATITVSGLSGYDIIYGFVLTASGVATSETFGLRINTDTGATQYNRYGGLVNAPTTYAAVDVVNQQNSEDSYFVWGRGSTNAASNGSGGFVIMGANSTNHKMIQSTAGFTGAGGQLHKLDIGYGFYKGNSVVSSISLVCISNSNFDGGTLFVYGAN